MKKSIFFIIMLLFVVCMANAQNKTAIKEDKYNKAKLILEKSKGVTGISKLSGEIKELSITYNTEEDLNVGDRKIRQTSAVEVDISFPDKISWKTSAEHLNTRTEEIFRLNGNKFFKKLDVFNNGVRQNIQLDTDDEKIDINLVISWLQRKAFNLTFPITLDAPWYMPLDFYYIGLAQSKDGEAEVIEAISKVKVTYRLFFDTKTHLLLLMTRSWMNSDNKEIENKYFFSDYQEKGELIIPTMIIEEQNGVVIEERQIKDIKVNPNYSPDFFRNNGK